MNSRLFEKAASVTDARKRGLALYVGSDGGEKMYMLYDADKLVTYVTSKKLNISTAETQLAKACAMGVITTKGKPGKAWKATEIGTSAAQQGYGPLIYDITMALENGVMADRESVSGSAKGVWDFYLNNRKDVTAKELDDEDEPKTKPKSDDATVFDGGDANPLNYAYFMKGSGPNVSKLIANHKACVSQMKKLDLPFELEFYMMGLELFHWKFKE